MHKIESSSYENQDIKANQYYTHYASQYISSRHKMKWNWSAALFTAYWLFYRKVYRTLFLYTALYLAFFILLTTPVILTIFDIISIDKIPSKIILLILENVQWLYIISFFIFGLWGNRLYFWEIHKNIENGLKPSATHSIKAIVCLLIFHGLSFSIYSLASYLEQAVKISQTIHNLP